MNLQKLENMHKLDGFSIVESGYLEKFSLRILAYGVTPRVIFGGNYNKHREIGNKMTKFVWNKLANTYNYRGNSVFCTLYLLCDKKKSTKQIKSLLCLNYFQIPHHS